MSLEDRNISSIRNNSLFQSGICLIDIKQILQQIFGLLFRKVKILFITTLVANIIHTYLLAYVNDGFRDDGDLVAKYINTRNNLLQIIPLWVSGGFLSWFYFNKIREVGWVSSIYQVINYIKSMAFYVSNPSPWVYKSIAAGFGLGYIISKYLHQSIQLIIGVIGFATFNGLIPAIIAGFVQKALIINASNLPKEVVYSNVNLTYIVNIVLMSSSITVFAFSNIELLNKVAIGIVLYLVYNAFIKGSLQMKDNQRLRVLLYFAFGIFACKFFFDEVISLLVYADDGGWKETVNPNAPIKDQLIQWFKSEASKEVIKAGIPPSISSGIGAAIADSMQEIKYYVLQISSSSIYLRPNQAEELVIAVWKIEGKMPPVLASDALINVSSATNQPWLQITNSSGYGMISCMLVLNPIMPNTSNVTDTENLLITASAADSTYCSNVFVKGEILASNYILELF